MKSKKKSTDEPTFFATAPEFRAWLSENHAKKPELLVGFKKIGTGKPSITWPQAVEQAIAHGWIDGIRHSIDRDNYTVRFTPRKQNSVWSAINIATAKRLIAEDQMTPAGLSAFNERGDDKSAIYSYEQRKNPKLTLDEKAQLESNAAAWKYFQSRPPSYQRTATWWVIGAKMKETRARRLAQLIDYSKKSPAHPTINTKKGKEPTFLRIF